jgi:hypothetical protein
MRAQPQAGRRDHGARHEMKHCPECRQPFDDEIAACPNCREVLQSGEPLAAGPTIVHRVPDAAAAALLCGMLVHNGIHAMVRSALLPAYGSVPRDWSTTAWGEIVTPAGEADAARELIADYLSEIERGGRVTDEDVEDAGRGE